MNTWLTLLTVGATLLTILVGIWQFSAQQTQANRQPFLQKQLEVCFQATETAGRLASETDPKEWEKGSDHLLDTLLGYAEHCGRPSRRGGNG